MASTIIPTQFRYNDPYQEEIFSYDTPESRLYKSRATNNLFKIIGNDIVVKGLYVEQIRIINDDIISVSMGDGVAISDLIVVNILETSVVDLPCKDLVDTISGAHLAIFFNYRYNLHPTPIIASIDAFHVSPFGVITDPHGRFNLTYHRILLAIIDFVVDAGKVVIAHTSSLSELSVEGTMLTLRGVNNNNLVLPKLFIRDSSNLIEESYEYLLKKDYLLME